MSPTDLPPEGLTPLPYAFPLVPASLRPAPPATAAKAVSSPDTAPTNQTKNQTTQKPINPALTA